jgi:aminoglycoside phosphotransferase (APT) family kinase protein
VIGWRRLTGGLTSLVHQVTVEQSGRRRPYVLRRWGSGGDRAEYAVASETAVLGALETTDIPAPRVVGATSEPANAGPAVLMTCLPGRMQLVPRDRERWLAEMARMLVRIHALDIDARPFQSWLDHSQLAAPPTHRAPTSGATPSRWSPRSGRPAAAASSIATTSTSTCSGRASG